MPFVLVLVLIVGAAFALIVVATSLVIIGVKQEEKAQTAFRGLRPQTVSALLARRILGAHFYLIPGQLPDAGPDLDLEDPEDEPPWYERPRPPRAR